MFVNDEELIQDFHLKSGHCMSSVRSYRTVFNKYCTFHNMSLCELLSEAIAEQENRIPENRLSIYDRIISFRNFLVENHVGNTVSNSISKIKTFYKYNRVYLPYIPPLNIKNIKRNEIISFSDLPTKEELRHALSVCSDDIALWIMVMISSGVTRREAKSMTNQTFFKGTYEYHRKDNFRDALKWLSGKNNVICTCDLIRQKTSKLYYTFLNPECVQRIAEVKLKQGDYDLDSPLLKYDPNYLNYKFKILNDRLNLGEVGGYSRLRPHMLRKFNASYLNQNFKGKQLSMDDVDCLHGRGKDKTRESYFKENPHVLKLKYVSAMNNISLYHSYEWKVVKGRIRVIVKS